jgi:hypothetical protein
MNKTQFNSSFITATDCLLIYLATSLETTGKGEQKIAMVGQGNMSESSIVG